MQTFFLKLHGAIFHIHTESNNGLYRRRNPLRINTTHRCKVYIKGCLVCKNDLLTFRLAVDKEQNI